MPWYYISVSILVLLDASLEAFVIVVFPRVYVVFQSLFSWMFPSKHPIASTCKHGDKFQSLFSWMFPSKCSSSAPISGPCWFQSLFSWMFPSKIAFIIGFLYRRKFQSLFSWMFPSKLRLHLRHTVFQRVSIL